METLIYYSSMLGGLLLSLTLLWVGFYNYQQHQTKKAILFSISGLAIAIILIYSILFPQ
ncbi:hypothetical protein PIPA1_31680 [Pelosinus sp. IPA-1]|nr:hypothetical protein PIPA1_31680 [Pelosinus sp. IPA-1]